MLAFTREASAFPVYRRYLKEVYGGSVPAARCEACHQRGGGSERNAYGKHWAKSGGNIAAFKAIESADSDGDGVTGTPDGGVDINDLLFYLIRFEGGC